MIPIDQLLNRIRWDKEFGRGEFEIGYHDRFANDLIRLPLSYLSIPEDAPHVFEIIDDEGTTRRVPFHRVRKVWKDKNLIWERKAIENQ